MADEKSGRKPEKEGGSGTEKGDESEAGGRRRVPTPKPNGRVHFWNDAGMSLITSEL